MKTNLPNTKSRANLIPPQMWMDVQDQNGVWRVGYIEKKDLMFKLISLDGFHPIYTAYYCQHSGKMLPVRTKTMGLTVPQDKTIRGVLKLKQIEQVSGKISLFQLISNQLENTPYKIRTFIRTELLIFIDKIFNTPFEILAHIKMVDVHINKLFMHTLEYYFRLLEGSKRFVNLLQSNQTALELYKATYQMSQLISIILGVHKRSKAFYDSPANKTITESGIMDFFIKYQGGGILPFKLFFKSCCGLKNVQKEDLTICLQTITLFLSLCQKYQSDMIEGRSQTVARLVIDQVINMIKNFSQKNKDIAIELKGKVELISRIQTLYFKLFPNSQCTLRKFLQGQKPKQNQKSMLREIQTIRTMTRMKSDLGLNIMRPTKTEKDSEKVKELQSKIEKMEESLKKLQVVNIHEKQVLVESKETQPTQNMGEEAFLGSLEWALDAGDMTTCRKLVSWRKSLLKLGRITGWQIALAVGRKTFKSKEIHPQDIIEANYDFIAKQGLSSK